MSSTTPPFDPRQTPRLRPIEDRDSQLVRDPELDSYADFSYGDLDLDYGDDELTAADRVRRFGGMLLVRAGWCLLVAALSFGAAGIVAAMSHSPDSTNRPDLTYQADNQLSTRLDAAIRDLALLNDDVQSLGDQTRKALSSLAQVNQVGLKAAWDAGSNDVNSIDARAQKLEGQLSCASWSADLVAQLLESYSPEMIDRYNRVCQAVESVSPLRDDWTSLVAGTKTAMQVATDINDHDQIAGDALQLATKGRYADALTQLKQAAASISDASGIADEMAKVADVSTLQEWLRRTTDMDDALAVLWQTMIDTKGEVTAQVTAALKNVNSAKDLLPDSTAVMGVALHEMAGGLTSNGISIETARGNLANALAALVGPTSE